jgi:hypothetical protein
MKKPIPEFKNEEEERQFWATHDSSDYLDWRQAKRVVFPNLKPSTKPSPCDCRSLCWMKFDNWQINVTYLTSL